MYRLQHWVSPCGLMCCCRAWKIHWVMFVIGIAIEIVALIALLTTSMSDPGYMKADTPPERDPDLEERGYTVCRK